MNKLRLMYALVLMTLAGGIAQAQVVLPAVGTDDVADYVTAALAYIGIALTSVLGGYIAIRLLVRLVKMAVRMVTPS